MKKAGLEILRFVIRAPAASCMDQVLGESSLKELGLSTVEILASVVSRSGGSGGVTKPVDYLSIVPVLVKQVLVTRSQPASKVTLSQQKQQLIPQKKKGRR